MRRRRRRARDCGVSAAAGEARCSAAVGSSGPAASVSCSGRGRDTSLARIAALRVIFMPAMHLVCATGTRQKIRGHHGAGSQDMAADSRAMVPGRDWVTRPAAASVPSLVPPR